MSIEASAGASSAQSDRTTRRRATGVVALQAALGMLYALQLALYLSRSRSAAGSTLLGLSDAGAWRIPAGILGGIAWYVTAYAVALALALGLTGLMTLVRRHSRLSPVHTWLLAVGSAICVVILAVAFTPLGQDLHTWWLD